MAGIVGFGRAALLAGDEMGEESARLVGYRERVSAAVTAQIDNAYLIGHPYQRLPGFLCFGFSGQEADAIRLLFALDDAGIAVSSGSACSAHNAGEPSYVLTAMGFDTIRARGSMRLTMGRFTSDARHRPPARSAPHSGGVAHLDRLARRVRRALVKEHDT